MYAFHITENKIKDVSGVGSVAYVTRAEMLTVEVMFPSFSLISRLFLLSSSDRRQNETPPFLE